MKVGYGTRKFERIDIIAVSSDDHGPVEMVGDRSVEKIRSKRDVDGFLLAGAGVTVCFEEVEAVNVTVRADEGTPSPLPRLARRRRPVEPHEREIVISTQMIDQWLQRGIAQLRPIQPAH